MEEKKFLEMLEDVMEVDEGTLEMNTVLSELEEWDSLSKLSLMAVVKKDFNKVLTASDIKEFETVENIYQALI